MLSSDGKKRRRKEDGQGTIKRSSTSGGAEVRRTMNPKLIRKCDLQDQPRDKQCPSAFLAEMALSTEERFNQTYEMHIPEIIELLDMSEMSLQKYTTVDIEEPLFQPFPSEIIFQNFEAQQTYRVPLQLRNNDQVARLVKVVQAATPYFQVISPPDVAHKVAPGMDTVFYVQFTPDQKKDYNHEIICITEREKFLIPVKAIGARGFLDLPDEIHFGSCPVKYKSSKTILVRNIGNTECKFSLLTEPPYSVVPDTGILGIGDSMQLEVCFDPQKTGGCTSHMAIQYETGEEIYVGLHGDASDMNVRLDKNTVRLDNTYSSSISRRSVQLSNRSDVLVHFSWKSFATLIEEEQQKLLYHRELQFQGSTETDAFLDECIADPLMRDKFSLVSRSIRNKVKVTEDNKLLYDDDNIIIEPLEGEIWPGTSVDINIIFKPDEARTYSRTAFCDLTGREARLPLRIRGDGIGPKIQFSFDTLDVENVFIDSQHSYEIVIVNKGDIDAVFSHEPSSSLFGAQFSFTPTQGLVRPGEYQAIQIFFNPTHLGQFLEAFYWNVEGTEEKFKFNVRGCVIGPTFHFDVPHIKFATISYGFTYQQSCKLVNTSLIPMTFNLHAPTDGHGALASEITSNFLGGKLSMSDAYKMTKLSPVEIEILPRHGVLMPLSEIDIQINFTPMNCGKYDGLIAVDVEGIGMDLLTLPVSAKCIVPSIDISPQMLDYGRCFIRHAYERIVLLHNETDLPAKYELITQIQNEDETITYSSPMPRGVLNPRSVLEIPLHVCVAALGPTDVCVYFSIFGLRQEFLQVQVKAIGEGPVVCLSERDVNFGTIPVLTDTNRVIQLRNESLIPAEFYCEMVRMDSLYSVTPASSIIPPEQSIPLTVSVNVNDNTRFNDKLHISINDGVMHSVNLTANGTGTTIYTEPQFGPVYDLGPQFSCRTIHRTIRFHNRGRRQQQIYWMTEGFSAVKKRKDYNSEDMKYKNLPPPPDPPKPIFKLTPDRLNLNPGKYCDVVLEGCSQQIRDVKERLICQAIVGKVMGKEKIMVVDVQANFIQPLLKFSQTQLTFTVVKVMLNVTFSRKKGTSQDVDIKNQQPDELLSKEVKQVMVKNISPLPLQVEFNIGYPFQFLKRRFGEEQDDTGNLLEASSFETTIDVDGEQKLLVQFDPYFIDDSYSRKAESLMEIIYKDHPSTDSFELKGEVFYPNLDFESLQVNFDSILNDTEHLKTIKVTNNSPLDVYYTWSFVQQDIKFEGKDIDEGFGTDSSDDERIIIQPIDSNPNQVMLHDSFCERPKTTPPASNINLDGRPATAPPSSELIKVPKVSAVTWSQLQIPPTNVGIEEVFDILPLYGCLKPSEVQQFQFSFYGHSHILAEATAVCSIRDGPDYKIHLNGQASLIKYTLSVKDIDFGRQLYDQVNSYQITLFNNGKVSFDFVALNVSEGKVVQPGLVHVSPAQGVVECGSSVVIGVKYIAGVPEDFKKTFQIRVAHFEPENISIYGAGVFPRITLNLPKDEESPVYKGYYSEAKHNITEKNLQVPCEDGLGDEFEPFDWDIQEEIERLEVKCFAIDKMKGRIKEDYFTADGKKIKIRPQLTSYVLDFGPVVLGTVATQMLKLTNAGYFPVSLFVEHKCIFGTGFYVDLDRVKGLPGFPQNESLDFEVVFNPLTANLSLGPVETSLPIKLKSGPEVSLLLRAYVTVPDITLSSNMIEFNDVICGQCKVVTIQIENTTRVRTDWEYEAPQDGVKEKVTSQDIDDKNQFDKHTPMHLRKALHSYEPQPKIFEVMPPSGSLAPGQKVNVQVKFMPTEENVYQGKLCLKINQNSESKFISCRGQGREPHIEFDKTLLKFGPILPYSGRDEVFVKVTNPGLSPLEFYSLEFDKQFLEEEEVLRSLKGYDEYNTLLLPPRVPGEKLPKELLEHYEEIQKRGVSINPDTSFGLNGSMLSVDDSKSIHFTVKTPSSEDVTDMKSQEEVEECPPVPSEESTKNADTVGDLEITPVSAAIASYLGIDLSPEGRAARNRRGIAIVVHGGYLAGKTATAHDLATKFHTALLTIDDVIIDALRSGTTSAATRARELCLAAAKLAKANSEIETQNSQEKQQQEVEASQQQQAAAAALGVGKLQSGRKTASLKQKQTQQQVAQQPPTPPAVPSVIFVSKKLDIDCEEEYYNCVLPDDLIVELLADRFQVSDCHQGLVIDGLDTMFTSSMTTAATLLLRAINNRKYIFGVTLKYDFEKLKETNVARQMEEEQNRLLEEEREWLRLEEMSEDEYDSLSAKEQHDIDMKRLNVKREKMKKKREEKKVQEERERKEKELFEEKCKEEEKLLGTGKKGRKSTIPEKGGKGAKEKKSVEKLANVKESTMTRLIAPDQSVRPDTSLTSERSFSVDEHAEKLTTPQTNDSTSLNAPIKKGKAMQGKAIRTKSGLMGKDRQYTPIDEVKDDESDEDKALRIKFRPYDSTLRDILNLFENWDRTTGTVVNPESEKGTEVEIPVIATSSVSRRSDKKKVIEKNEKVKDIKEQIAADSPALSQGSTENVDAIPTEENIRDGIGVPNIVLDTLVPQTSLCEKVMETNILPYEEQVLEGIGAGPSGPPIPPEATFSVAPFPAIREAPSINEYGQHYVFLPAENDALEDKSKGEMAEVPENVVAKKESKKHTKRGGSNIIDRQPSASIKKGRHSSMTKPESPPPSSPDKDGLLDKNSNRSMELFKHRWVVPAGGSVVLHVLFTSQDLGQFDQTLNFEIVGTRRRYQIYCRGVCSFPSISREPRIVFPNRRKCRRNEEIVSKKYILNSETFEFGPLLAGKNRERYREVRYPENMEKIMISNTSPMKAEISFAYLNDHNATTFMLEPPTASLNPGESQPLYIWAYPKTPGFYEDSIVCCIKENPEPVLFKVSTHGVRPELELDRKIIQFDRVLLHRKETRTVYLRNSTLLPVAWRLNGIDNLGDDFSIPIDHGVIDPMSEFGLQMHFRAIKPVTVKKVVRLEVSDAENIMGLAHAESLSVQAEAYDVALDMSFPKGADGGLDFGVLRVGEESKQTCTLKNKGRYEIAYHFVFEETFAQDGKSAQQTADLFTITPNRGSLIPSDRPVQVQVMFKSKDETTISELPILKCQIIEPSISEDGEVIANIPIKISARAVYSKYSIYPVNDINFGAVLINTKKTRTFVIENNGDFDFRYAVSKLAVSLQPQGRIKGVGRSASRQGSLYSGKSQILPQRSRRDSIKGADALGLGAMLGGTGVHNNVRLTVGVFTIFPANGVVLPGGTATITVDMQSEIALGAEEVKMLAVHRKEALSKDINVKVQEFIIDISERPPTDHPTGIEYRLVVETCLPNILSLSAGYTSIFEEHRIVKNLNVFRYHTQELPPGTGVYGEDEGRFTFYNTIVGHKVTGRFKVTNPNKVASDITFSVKPLSTKNAHRITDIFDIHPTKACILPHSSMFATVVFQPHSMQSYACVFEAMVEGLSPTVSKGRNLTFEIQGDGNLPRVAVLKPLTLTTKGAPIIVFNKILIERTQISPLVLKNDGTLPCGLDLKLTDPNQSFIVTLKTKHTPDSSTDEKEMIPLFTTSTRPTTSTIYLSVGETIEFMVEFSPKTTGRMNASLSLSVHNNPFEETVVHLVGEGYQEEITIDNIQLPYELSPSLEVKKYDGDNVTVPSSNQLNFGDCMINAPKTLHFTIFNRSASDVIRFYWDQYPGLTFKPSCGHIQANCAKDVSVTFVSSEPVKLEDVNVVCKVNKILLAKDSRKVYNWDNTRTVIRWIDDVPDITSQQQLPTNPATAAPTPNNNQQQIPQQTANNEEPQTAQQQSKEHGYHLKKKVIDVEEEPVHNVLADSYLEIDLICSVNCNYAKYMCKTDRVYFRETFIFQTRVFSFTMSNVGETSIDYNWSIQAGIFHPPSPIEIDESVKSVSKSSRRSRAPSTHKTNSSASSRNSAVKHKPQKKTALTQPNETELDVDANARPVSQVGYSADGRPASVVTLVYETGAPHDITLLPGTDDLPFTIEPQRGNIPVGEEATFTVRFSPLEMSEFNGILTANVENVEPTIERPIIALFGKSLLPWCHFELAESSYIAERRNPELRGPNGAAAGTKLDSNTKTVEFVACGISTKVTRKFCVLNPTDTSYSFQWIQDSMDTTSNAFNHHFTCHTLKGVINPGKKFEMKFDFHCDSLDLTESFWRFILVGHNVSVPFLLVGYGNEPAISLDRSHINFKQLLIGHTAKETVYLMNEESDKFNFHIAESSLHSAGHVASLCVEPMKGVIQGKEKLPITICYKPETESEVNFNLKCFIKKKHSSLTMNVKAHGFRVKMNLICEDSTGNKIKLSHKGMNVINFGNIEINEKSTRYIFIENNGQFNVDYTWSLTPPSKPKGNPTAWDSQTLPIAISPDSGTITPTNKKRCQLSFSPPVAMYLKKCMLTLKIVNGPTYQISLAGTGTAPALQFSFVTHDFGPCFVYRSGLPIQKKILHVLNADSKDISLECLYTSTNYLEVHCIAGVIAPGEKSEVEIRFYPREAKTYKERVVFEVNGLSVVHVDVIGEGTDMRVEVVDPAEKKVNLGFLKAKEKFKRPVRIINKSLATVDFSVTCNPILGILQNPSVLSVLPNNQVSLKPKQTLDLLVQFNPKSRVPKFSEEIILECAGASQPLFTITGACQGLEIRLDSDAIPFGSVTLGSSSSRKLIMVNTGDIGTRFEWNVDRFLPAFHITPAKGYISPGMEVSFEIVFLPTEVCQDIRCDDLRCTYESGSPSRLILTGSCIHQTPMKDVVHFMTFVRSRDVKNIAIQNKTNAVWTLKPVIDGEFWSGAETFAVEPQAQRNYEIAYRPLTMSHDSKKHTVSCECSSLCVVNIGTYCDGPKEKGTFQDVDVEFQGSVFFALPDGTGMLYNLIGTADPPKPVSNITRDVPCKMAYTELLNVSNWLRKPQRFRVIIELVKPEKPDPATTLKGLDYIDVPGLSKKEYKLHFFAHKEGIFSCKVTFKNETTSEYQFYYTTFKVGTVNSLGCVELTTPARQSVGHVVTLQNPLQTLVNFQTNCNLPDVNLPPMFTIPPQAEGSCTFEYLPLKAGTVAGRLTLNSLELGAYIYDLNLTATNAAPERAVHFISSLGTHQTQACKFTSYARTRVEYACKVDSTEFTVEKSVNAASAASGGSEVSVDVIFEPSRLGDCQGILTIHSPVGGEYTVPLYGHCIPPKPQGPFTIRAGSQTQIPFKNIFAQTTSYAFNVDNPCFTVKPGETIRAKKTHNVVVSFDGNQGDSKVVRMGRLVITCARSAGTGSNLSWTFYLKGVTNT